LLDNKGDTPCEIHVRQNGSIKKIKVPFGIKTNDTLENKLKELIA
jgi:hypothetical protein